MSDFIEQSLLQRAEEIKKLGQAEGLLEAAELALGYANGRDGVMAQFARELSRLGRARLPAPPKDER